MKYGVIIVITENHVSNKKVSKNEIDTQISTVHNVIKSYNGSDVINTVVMTANQMTNPENRLNHNNISYIDYSDEKTEETLSMIRAGLSCLKTSQSTNSLPERYLFLHIKQGKLDIEAIDRILQSKKDLVMSFKEGEMTSLIVFSSFMGDWFQLYNGNRGLKGAYDSLDKSHVEIIKMKKRINPTFNSRQNYLPWKAVINWV